MKPIIFNTEMVKAILEGRKTVTRRVVKPQPKYCAECQDDLKSAVYEPGADNLYCGECGFPLRYYHNDELRDFRAPYRTGDIMYVRETWHKDAGRYMYKANYSDSEKFYRDGKEVTIKWHPSIHMPREPARLFLRVTDVRVERLQDINEGDAKKEGFVSDIDLIGGTGKSAARHFADLWDSHIKPADRALYGWDANPWVWVIEFERISKEEGQQHE